MSADDSNESLCIGIGFGLSFGNEVANRELRNTTCSAIGNRRAEVSQLHLIVLVPTDQISDVVIFIAVTISLDLRLHPSIHCVGNGDGLADHC